MIISAMAVGLLSGCAFGDRKIALRYQPIAPIGGGTGQKVAVVKFIDRRGKQEVGEVRNGYGMKTASVYAQQQDIGAWVANALSDELSHAGFAVQKFSDAAPPDISISITGFVPEAYVQMSMQERCTVRANITVQKGGVVVLNKEYRGYISKVAWTASTGEYENVMQLALQELMKQAVPEIVAAIKT
jgi:hypothetical protein